MGSTAGSASGSWRVLTNAIVERNPDCFSPLFLACAHTPSKVTPETAINIEAASAAFVMFFRTFIISLNGQFKKRFFSASINHSYIGLRITFSCTASRSQQALLAFHELLGVM